MSILLEDLPVFSAARYHEQRTRLDCMRCVTASTIAGMAMITLLVFTAQTSIAADIGDAYDRNYDDRAWPSDKGASWVPVWRGLYFGGHIGGGYGETDDALDDIVSDDLDGFVGGFQMGFNWQRGGTVFGIESDYSFSGIESEFFDADVASVNYLTSLRGRIGIATGSSLFYATGGFAGAQAEVLGFDEDFSGFVLGVGAEHKLTNDTVLSRFGNTSLRGEILHYDLEADDLAGLDLDLTVFRAGLNIHLY